MRGLYVITLVIFSFNAFAQETENKKYRIPKYTLKWSPIHLLDAYPTLQFALEQRISRKISFQYDFGPVINSEQFSGYEDNSFRMRGYKAKLEIRHYLTPMNDRLWIPYVGGDLYYNRVNYRKAKTIGVNCVDGSCDYFRSVDYDMEYREPGLSIKGGVVFRTHRFSLDFQVGLRGRFIDYNAVNEPVDPRPDNNEGDDVVFFPFFTLFETNEEDRNTISPTACVRIGFVIK